MISANDQVRVPFIVISEAAKHVDFESSNSRRLSDMDVSWNFRPLHVISYLIERITSE